MDKQTRLFLENIQKKLSDLESAVCAIPKLKFYNYEEAAEILRISPDAVKKRVQRGQLKALKDYGTPIIQHSEIIRSLKQQNPDFTGF